MSGIAKVEYSLNGADYTEFTGDTIALSQQNFSGNVTFKVTDKAQHFIVSDGFALKLDMDDPTVSEMVLVPLMLTHQKISQQKLPMPVRS